MPIIFFPIVAAAVLIAAYLLYGRFLSRRFELSDKNRMPSETMTDGVDYVPTPFWVALGHHFSSIAGAGPIVGPVLATLWFGWGPAVLWILLGSVFIGGVQDFGSLMASIRHRAASIPDLAKRYLGKRAWILFLIIVWLALVYVIVVFLDLTATTFAANATVANASVIFIGLALVMGLLLRSGALKVGTATLIFVPLVFGALWLGSLDGLQFYQAGNEGVLNFWRGALLIYCLIASVAPVWILLQPRDYLSSFLLYAAVLGGGIGLIIAGAGGMKAEWPAFITPTMAEEMGQIWHGPLFPILFITIACGACSGFHSIVASGTTARQIKSETDARRVGYGAMLIEGFVAILSVCTVAFLAYTAANASTAGGNAVAAYANGMGAFLNSMGIPVAVGTTFAALAVSTFLLTTLDTCTRLVRYITQELSGLKNESVSGRTVATIIALTLPAIFVFIKYPDGDGNLIPAWKAIWPVFGATNQFLGAMALLGVTVWLRRTGRAYLFAGIPMIFMLAVTMSALAALVWKNGVAGPVGMISAVLFILGLGVVVEAVLSLKLGKMEKETDESALVMKESTNASA